MSACEISKGAYNIAEAKDTIIRLDLGASSWR